MSNALAVSVLALVLVAPAAQAGDVCPISVFIQDNGTPDGVDRAALLAALESKSSWLGITFEGVTFAKEGDVVRVTQIHADSPAAEAGIRTNDRLLVIDGRAVTTRAEADAAFGAVEPTAPVTLQIRRDGQVIDVTLMRAPRDPVVAALIAAAKQKDCVAPELVAAERGEDRARAWASVTTAKGGLRCKDAHKALAAKDPDAADRQEGLVQVFRTADELLFTMPSFATVCVKAADLDGAKLDDKALGKLFDRVAGAYLAREKRRTP
ncbi:MAG: PDZ domain-containing protein [Deltaproteobacteria bacterium]|nr:PDZ domain-containing protein [Deltaproteobacteria bacterium]